MRSSRMRAYVTPPYMFFDPGNGPRSSRHTESPPRADTRAAAEPAGPAPTTTTSKRSGVCSLRRGRRHTEPPGQRDGQGRRVGDEGEVGHQHHGCTGIEVDRHDILGLSDAAHVLHRSRNAYRDVEIGVHHLSGGADLTTERGPTGIGHHAGGTGG